MNRIKEKVKERKTYERRKYRDKDNDGKLKTKIWKA
jgi:hypothetical protein